MLACIAYSRVFIMPLAYVLQLALNNNNIGDTGAVEIARVLSNKCVLTEACAARWREEEIGLCVMRCRMPRSLPRCHMAQFSLSRTQIGLNNNNISAMGAAELAKALKTNRKLTRVC